MTTPYTDHYTEYIGQSLTICMADRPESTLRGKVVSADPIGLKLEIMGRTKIYHNFYPWSRIDHVIYVSGKVAGVEGEIKPRLRRARLKPEVVEKTEVVAPEKSTQTPVVTETAAQVEKKTTPKKPAESPVLKGREKTDVLLGKLISEDDENSM